MLNSRCDSFSSCCIYSSPALAQHKECIDFNFPVAQMGGVDMRSQWCFSTKDSEWSQNLQLQRESSLNTLRLWEVWKQCPPLHEIHTLHAAVCSIWNVKILKEFITFLSVSGIVLLFIRQWAVSYCEWSTVCNLRFFLLFVSRWCIASHVSVAFLKKEIRFVSATANTRIVMQHFKCRTSKQFSFSSGALHT